MDYVEDIAALEALYGVPRAASLSKVTDRLLPLHGAWIAAARFCVLSTIGPNGTDGSPRGDDGPVVLQLDAHRLAMPDWRGNNRMDSIRNIVADGRLSLMFMVAGSNTVIRVNGRGRVTTDVALLERFAKGAKLPRSVILIEIDEVYLQCSRAPMRAGLWSRDDSTSLPSVGALMEEASGGAIDADEYEIDAAIRKGQSNW